MKTQHLKKIKVWDLPTRLFHWGMVLLLSLLWWSADAGEMQWHQVFAYSLLVLISFRLLWGFWGSDSAKFSHFLRSPKVALEYLKAVRQQGVTVVLGHNPLGGYMVLALIALVTIQLTSGLFATDDIFTEGPLYAYVSADTASWLTWLHKMNFNVILALSTIHVLAVVIHLIKGDKLLSAMFSGYKKVAEDRLLSTTLPSFQSLWFAFILFTILAGLVFYYLIWPILQML